MDASGVREDVVACHRQRRIHSADLQVRHHDPVDRLRHQLALGEPVQDLAVGAHCARDVVRVVVGVANVVLGVVGEGAFWVL